MSVQALRYLLLTVLLCCAVLISSVSANQEPPAKLGLIVSVEGNAQVLRGTGPVPAVEGFVLQTSDTVFVAMGGICSGFTPGGERFELKGPGRITFAVQKERRNRIAAWIAQQVAHWIGESRDYSLVSRSSRDWQEHIEPLRLILPAPDAKVRASRAQFYWSTIPSVDRYELIIIPESGEEMRQTVRGYKAVKTDLTPGGRYYWTVRPEADEPYPSPGEQSFLVMTLEEERNLDGSLSELPDLEAGVLLLSSGLYDEAIYRFDAAVSGGDNRQSALRWRAQALAAIQLYDEAYRDLSETIK